MRALSNNHFSVDLQLADVVNWLATDDPVRYQEFIREFPEWPEAAATLTGTSSWIDCEELGLGEEFSSWCIDWIEQRTDVHWEDGEPWVPEWIRLTIEIDGDFERFWEHVENLVDEGIYVREAQ